MNLPRLVKRAFGYKPGRHIRRICATTPPGRACRCQLVAVAVREAGAWLFYCERHARALLGDVAVTEVMGKEPEI